MITMENIGSTVAWSTVQVSLVALVGIGLALLIGRRNSFAAGSIVSMAVVVSAVLTFVAPLPIHRWFMLESQSTLAVALSTPNVPADRPETITTEDLSHAVTSPVPMLSLRELTASLRSLVRRVESFEKRDRIVIQAAVWLLMAVVGLGLVRLAVGLAYVSRLRRSGVPITDSKVLEILEKLSARFHCRTVPQIREIPEFTDAAVAGWFRPTLILPRGWQQWTADELQAVLAHELVHIVRRDSLWRALASGLLAIHFYNPVLHWLLRRVVLYQELVADVLAAEVVGQRSYLRSLSSLAIRRDDRIGRSVSPAVLPVFSCQLIRRINVLHSMDGRLNTSSRRRRNIASAMTALALFALGFATVATRGIAQPPAGAEKEQKATAGKVKRISFTNVATENKSGLDPTQEMFRQSSLDPSVLGTKNRQGMVAIRPRELLRHPELRAYVPVLNGLLSTWMASELKSKSPPMVTVESIDWIAAVPNASFKAATKDKKSEAMFGVTNPVIKLSQPLDLKLWIERYAPQAKSHVVEGLDVFQLDFASLGPIPCHLWMADATTIQVSLQPKGLGPDTKLADLFPVPKGPLPPVEGKPEPAPEAKALPWTTTWNRIDSGVISVVLAKADLSGLLSDLEQRPDFQNELNQAIGRAWKTLMSRCKMTAFSCDMPEGKSQFGVRFNLIHDSRDAAVQSAQDVREILTLLKGEFTRQLNASPATDEPDEFELGIFRLEEAAFQSATVSVDEYPDGTAAVVIATALPFDKLIEMVIQVMNDSADK